MIRSRSAASLESRDAGFQAHRCVRLGSRRPHCPARVPGDDAARGFRLPRRSCAPAVRSAQPRRGAALRARDRGLPRTPGREDGRRRVQHRDLRCAAGPAGAARRAGGQRDRPRGARGRAGDAEPAHRSAGHRVDRRERTVRGARAHARCGRARHGGRLPEARAADRGRRHLQRRRRRRGARVRGPAQGCGL